MRLIIEGHDKVYDLQSIASAFFPGQSFSEGLPVIESFVRNECGSICCITKIKGKKGIVIKEYHISEYSKDAIRTAVKGSFFLAAEEYTGLSLPWGEFSGIRPVKYMSSLSDNVNAAKELFCKTLRVSKNKAELCERVLNYRENIPLENGKRDFSLYISIPFCPSRCTYCSFISQAGEKMLSLIPEYVEALCNEIKEIGIKSEENSLTLRSIYMGGGTPAVLSPMDMERILNTVNCSFNTKSVKEFTVEMGRPDAITEEKLRVLKNFGVDRVSINPQTLNNSVLTAIGRKHTAEQFYTAFNLAKNIGFRTINADIIVGLPNDNAISFENTVDELIRLNAENITVHSLCLKKSSWLKVESETEFLKNKTAFYMSDYANAVLLENGYEPYYMYKQKNAVGSLENTGFCKCNTESYYNIVMMDDIQNIIGVGAGSTTKLFSGADPQRIYNCKYPFEYISHKDKIITNICEIDNFFKGID